MKNKLSSAAMTALIVFLFMAAFSSALLGAILWRQGHLYLSVVIGFLWVFFIPAATYFIESDLND